MERTHGRVFLVLISPRHEMETMTRVQAQRPSRTRGLRGKSDSASGSPGQRLTRQPDLAGDRPVTGASLESLALSRPLPASNACPLIVSDTFQLLLETSPSITNRA